MRCNVRVVLRKNLQVHFKLPALLFFLSPFASSETLSSVVLAFIKFGHASSQARSLLMHYASFSPWIRFINALKNFE